MIRMRRRKGGETIRRQPRQVTRALLELARKLLLPG